MREHQIVISLKPEQFQEVQKQARAAGAQSVGAFVRQNLLHFLGLEEADSAKKGSQIATAVQADPDWRLIAGELRRLHRELKVLASEATVSTTLLTEIAGSSGSGPLLASSLALGETCNEAAAEYMQPAVQENFLTDGAPFNPDDYPDDIEESLILPPAHSAGGAASMPFQFQTPTIPTRSPYGLPMPSGQIPLSSPFSHHTFMPNISPLPGDIGLTPGPLSGAESLSASTQESSGAEANQPSEPALQAKSETVSEPAAQPVEDTHQKPDFEPALDPAAIPVSSTEFVNESVQFMGAAPCQDLTQVAPTVSPPVSEAAATPEKPASPPAPAAPAEGSTQTRSAPTPQTAGADQSGAFTPQKDDMEVLADRAFAISPRLGAIEPEVTMQPAKTRSFADTLEELLDAGLINQVLSQPDEDPSDQYAGEVEAPPEDDLVQVFIQEVEVSGSPNETDSESYAESDKVSPDQSDESEDAPSPAIHHEPPPPPRPIGAEDEDDKDLPPKPPPRRKKLI